MITMDLKKNENLILVIGKTEGHLDQSVFAINILNEKKGPPPEVNLFNEKNNKKIKFNKKIDFELDKINTSIAGPKRPQDLIKLDEISKNFKKK